MSNVRPEIELYLRKIINSEGEILFQSMNMRSILPNLGFSMYSFYSWFVEEHGIALKWQKGEGNQDPKPH